MCRQAKSTQLIAEVNRPPVASFLRLWYAIVAVVYHFPDVEFRPRGLVARSNVMILIVLGTLY